jgi:hypothetical protein
MNMDSPKEEPQVWNETPYESTYTPHHYVWEVNGWPVSDMPPRRYAPDESIISPSVRKRKRTGTRRKNYKTRGKLLGLSIIFSALSILSIVLGNSPIAWWSILLYTLDIVLILTGVIHMMWEN